MTKGAARDTTRMSSLLGILFGQLGIVPALLVLCSAVTFVVVGLLALYLVVGAIADLFGGGATGHVDGQPR